MALATVVVAALLVVAVGARDPTARLSVCPAALLADHRSQHHTNLAGAQSSVRSLLNGGHDGDIVVELCAGRHAISSTLVLGPEDSPADGRHVEWRGPLGGRATLDSGIPIVGWKLSPPVTGTVGSTTVWQAPLPAGARSRQLWVNSRRSPRAHGNPSNCSGGPNVPGDLPDKGPGWPCDRTLTGGPSHGKPALTTLFPVATGYTGVPDPQHRLSSKPLEDWLPGTELVFGKGGSGASWTEPRCSVASVHSNGNGTAEVVMEQPCWDRAIMKGGKLGIGMGQAVRSPSDIENALVLLVTPGQWYGDFAKGVVYYAPLPGETPQTLRAVLGSEPNNNGEHPGSTIVLLPGSKNMGFSNLEFMHQTWMQPSTPAGFVDLQSGYFFSASLPSGQGTSLQGIPGALAMHGAKGIVVSNCSFAHLGLTGVLADEHSQNIKIIGSEFSDVSCSAISIGNVSQPIQTPAEQDGQFTVTNNMIRLTGNEYHGCAGVTAGYVAQTEISHNDIANTSNGAIVIGWGWGASNTMHDNKINYNKITRSNTELYDCGSIYTLSAQPNSEVAYNYIVNQILLFGSLYHDAKSGFFHTHHNVVVGGPMWLYLQWGPLGPVHDTIVEDNYHNQTIAGGCGDKGPHGHFATCPQNLTVRNNVLVQGSAWPAAALAIAAKAGIAK